MKQKRVARFEDAEFETLRYSDEQAEFYIGFKNWDANGKPEFPGMTIDEIIEEKIRGQLSGYLGRKITGTFTPSTFTWDDPFLIMNLKSQVFADHLVPEPFF